MQQLRQRVGPSWIVVLACVLAAGCAQRPVASALRPEPAFRWSPAPQVPAAYDPQPAGDVAGGGARGTVDFSTVGTGRFAHVEEMLAGRVAGLDVLRRADGRFSLRVRGAASFNGGGEPLLVVDGMPINGDAAEVLATLAPFDVQRVDVLKDAGATAIYGSRGANGVVVITTRRSR